MGKEGSFDLLAWRWGSALLKFASCKIVAPPFHRFIPSHQHDQFLDCYTSNHCSCSHMAYHPPVQRSLLSYRSTIPTSSPLEHPNTPIALHLIQELLSPPSIRITLLSFILKSQTPPIRPLLRHPYNTTHIPRNPRIQHPNTHDPSTHVPQLDQEIVMRQLKRLGWRAEAQQWVVGLDVCKDVGDGWEAMESEDEGC
jgi:hypothetical protein